MAVPSAPGARQPPPPPTLSAACPLPFPLWLVSPPLPLSSACLLSSHYNCRSLCFKIAVRGRLIRRQSDAIRVVRCPPIRLHVTHCHVYHHCAVRHCLLYLSEHSVRHYNATSSERVTTAQYQSRIVKVLRRPWPVWCCGGLACLCPWWQAIGMS